MLVLHARLRFGAYDAGSDVDPRDPEWPPHPARLFCALVASDPSEDEWAALKWLEAQGAPTVSAPPLVPGGRYHWDAFVPTNDIKAASPSLPGRNNGLRVKPRAVPSADRFHLTWPDADPPPAIRAELDRLAARVPYVGRATASAELWFDDNDTAPDDYEHHEPAVLGADHDLRVPYPGYCERLRDLHERGDRSWEASRRRGYRLRIPPSASEPEAIQGPFGRLMVWQFQRPAHLHASLVAEVGERLRSAVMSLLPEPLPPEITGHGADGRPHVAYLSLPNVGQPSRLPDGPELAYPGNPHADGRILGVALAMPAGQDELARMLHRHLRATPPDAEPDTAPPLATLNLGRSRPALSVQAPTSGGPIGASPWRWTRPSAIWATATPVVLDRYPKQRDPAELVAEALVTAGYPMPQLVVANRSPFLPGSPHISTSRVQRRAGVPPKPAFHAWVSFDQPVRGPVIAGSMRYRGLGLFLPLEEVQQGDDPDTTEVEEVVLA